MKMGKKKKLREGLIESKDVPLYVLNRTGLRVSTRRVHQWLKKGLILRVYPLEGPRNKQRKFTTTKQVDKFLEKMSDGTKFKNSLSDYQRQLFDQAHR
jgi:hypothetical protein